MNIPEPCPLTPQSAWRIDPVTGQSNRVFTYREGERCWRCGHLWVVHAFDSIALSGGGGMPSGCTQCWDAKVMLESILASIGTAIVEALEQLETEQVADGG